MKRNKKKLKLSFEKFIVVKFENMKNVQGGTEGGGGTMTGGQTKDSGLKCLTIKPQNPNPNPDPNPNDPDDTKPSKNC